MKKIDSLYIHFPFCVHLCNYCDFYKKVSQNIDADYALFEQLLWEQMAEHQKLIEEKSYYFVPLKTLYLGGGTPSLWGKRGAIFLKRMFDHFNISIDAKAEVTLEVNPKTFDAEGIEAFETFGVNRFSLGVQAYDAHFLPYLDRQSQIEDVDATLTYFAQKKSNFSLDLMLGLPFSENRRDVLAEINQLLKFNPEHFSVYILTVKDNYKHYQELPSEEAIEAEFLKVASHLEFLGFHHYEVSNFAKPGRMSSHNLKYWKSETVAALGPSATGFLAESRLRYKWKTQKNIHQPNLYEVETLDEEAFRLEKIYLALRSMQGLNLREVFANEEKAIKIFNRFKEFQYLRNESKIDSIVLNSRGYLLLDSLMNDLFNTELDKN